MERLEAPEYVPTVGFLPSFDHIQRAIAEFRRIQSLDPDAPPLLVASQLPLQQWLASATCIEVRGVKFEALFHGDATTIDAFTMADLYMERIVDFQAYGVAIPNLVQQLTRCDHRYIYAGVNGHYNSGDRPHFPMGFPASASVPTSR